MQVEFIGSLGYSEPLQNLAVYSIEIEILWVPTTFPSNYSREKANKRKRPGEKFCGFYIRESSSCISSYPRYVLVICRSAYMRTTKRRMVTRLARARVSYNSTKAHKRVFDRWRSRFRRKIRGTHFFVACTTTKRTHALKVHTKKFHFSYN